MASKIEKLELLTVLLLLPNTTFFSTSGGILDFQSFLLHLSNEMAILTRFALKSDHVDQLFTALVLYQACENVIYHDVT